MQKDCTNPIISHTTLQKSLRKVSWHAPRRLNGHTPLASIPMPFFITGAERLQTPVGAEVEVLIESVENAQVIGPVSSFLEKSYREGGPISPPLRVPGKGPNIGGGNIQRIPNKRVL